MPHYRWWWAGSVLALYAGTAQALPFGMFDPRAMAMGGAGVAAAQPAEAGYYNPALLALPRGGADHFGLDLPSVTATLADRNKLRSSLNTFQANDNTQRFSDAIAAFKANPNQANANAAATAGRALLTDLQSLSGKAVDAEVVGGVAAAVPGPGLGMALTVDTHAVGGALLNVTSSDITAIDAALTKIQNLDPSVSDPTLSSSLHGTGAAVAEAGISLAHRWTIAGVPLALGITPKAMRIETFDYAVNVKTASLKLDQGRKSYNGFNLDVGAAADLTAHWRAAVTVKDVLARRYTTALNGVIRIKPQARAGVAYTTRHATLALDADLTANDATGLTAPTRYVALGGEFDLWGWAQLRAGYRYNTEDHNTNAASVGLGVSPFGLHLDLAALVSSRVLGAGVQTGVRF